MQGYSSTIYTWILQIVFKPYRYHHSGFSVHMSNCWTQLYQRQFETVAFGMGERSFFYAGIFHVLVTKTSSFLIIPAGMNYYLAVIPFLGAVEAGLFGQLQYEIEILPPEERRDDFCYSVADCRSRIPKLMDKWKAYFEVNNVTSFFFFYIL